MFTCQGLSPFSLSVLSDSCDTMVCSLPSSSVHGILQARILEWVATSLSRVCSPPRNQTQLSCIAGRFVTSWATRKATLSLRPVNMECLPIDLDFSFFHQSIIVFRVYTTHLLNVLLSLLFFLVLLLIGLFAWFHFQIILSKCLEVQLIFVY